MVLLAQVSGPAASPISKSAALRNFRLSGELTLFAGWKRSEVTFHRTGSRSGRWAAGLEARSRGLHRWLGSRIDPEHFPVLSFRQSVIARGEIGVAEVEVG